MEVFLMVRRKNLTIFLDAKDNTTVLELKRMIEGITKRPPEDQVLYKDDLMMGNDKTLSEFNLTPATGKPQSPVQLGLCFGENGQFETLDITPFSVPPELPDAMKPSESQGIEPSN